MPRAKVETVCLGLDPGRNGGLAVLWPGAGVTLRDFGKMSVLQLWDYISRLPSIAALDYGSPLWGCLERVGGYVKRAKGQQGHDHDNRQPGHHMFSFGVSYGHLEMALVGSDISYLNPSPVEWQKTLRTCAGLPERPRGLSPQGWKRVLRDFAQTLCPDVRVTLKTADALLLAHYVKIIREG